MGKSKKREAWPLETMIFLLLALMASSELTRPAAPTPAAAPAVAVATSAPTTAAASTTTSAATSTATSTPSLSPAPVTHSAPAATVSSPPSSAPGRLAPTPSVSPAAPVSPIPSRAPPAGLVVHLRHPSRCLGRGGLPDPLCTPGALDPRVQPQDVRQTACAAGYSDAVAPAPAVVSRLTETRLAAYGVTAGNYELDRLVPADLGGSATDPANLWPQPLGLARAKDRLEAYLHTRVCAGTMSLTTAQDSLRHTWLAAYDRYLAP